MHLDTTLRRIATGQATRDEVAEYFTELERQTREAVLSDPRGRKIASKPNGYAAFDPGYPDGVVCHVPALGGSGALDGHLCAAAFMREGAGASSNVLVCWPSGKWLVPVHPMMPSWHTGDPDGKAGPAPDYNRRRVGVDVISPGPLQRLDGDWYRPGKLVRREGKPGWWWATSVRQGKPVREWPIRKLDGTRLDMSEVADYETDRERWPFGLRYWHAPTEDQLSSLLLLLRALMILHPTIRIDRIVGHSALAPGKRVDPGPQVPLDRMRDFLGIGGDLTRWVETEGEGGREVER